MKRLEERGAVRRIDGECAVTFLRLRVGLTILTYFEEYYLLECMSNAYKGR